MKVIKYLLIVLLLITNLLTLTWGAFNATLSTAVTAVSGVETVMQKRSKSVKKFGNRLLQRTARTTTRSIASIPLEAVPYVGVAAILTVTALEAKAACDSVNDMNQMYLEFGIKEQASPDLVDKICNPALPSIEELSSRFSKEG